MSPDLLLVVMAVCVVPALFSVLSISPRRPDPLELWSVIVWLGTLYWAWSGRWVIFRPSLPRLCWIIVPTVLAAVPFLSGRPAGWLEPVLSAIGIAAVLIVWSLTPPRRVWIPLALVSLLLLAPATACVCVGGARHLHGLTWSHVADIRDGQIHRQYPLRNDELMKVGAVGTVPGLLLACMAFAAALMTRRDAASKTG